MALIGMGYVGLPLAVVFAEAGFQVTGIDLDEKKTAMIIKGSVISGYRVRKAENLTEQGSLKAVNDFSVLQDIDLVSICVPTPLRKTGDPDLSLLFQQLKKLLLIYIKTWPSFLNPALTPEQHAKWSFPVWLKKTILSWVKIFS
jgi:UDP-N-acetyl-D-glucosamine dehydrogenase